jgi:glyoxylase-like metal-dependent hydrolase (beta-lactamase superfamily II)
MTQIERVTDDVYVFTSELYAQVTAGVVNTRLGAILIDTLPYPTEALEMKQFVESQLSSRVRYVINTHYHADHVYGTYIFAGAQVISHELCRQLLSTVGVESLTAAKAESSELSSVKIVLPQITFEGGSFRLRLGGKTVVLNHSPGHSKDVINVLVEGEQVLFASDTVMPVPFFPDGDIKQLLKSLENILTMAPDLTNLVQGHGPVILRGEVGSYVEKKIKYLKTIDRAVRQVLKRRYSKKALAKTDLASVDIDRAVLGGLAEELHLSNLDTLYNRLKRYVKPYPSRSR